jgi:hypothetical protein
MRSVKIERILEGRTSPVGHSAVCPSVILYVSSVKLHKDPMKFGTEVYSGSNQANFSPVGVVWCTFCRKLRSHIKFLPKYPTYNFRELFMYLCFM